MVPSFLGQRLQGTWDGGWSPWWTSGNMMLSPEAAKLNLSWWCFLRSQPCVTRDRIGASHSSSRTGLPPWTVFSSWDIAQTKQHHINCHRPRPKGNAVFGCVYVESGRILGHTRETVDPIPTQATQATYSPKTWLRHPTLDAKGLGVETVLCLCPWLGTCSWRYPVFGVSFKFCSICAQAIRTSSVVSSAWVQHPNRHWIAIFNINQPCSSAGVRSVSICKTFPSKEKATVKHTPSAPKTCGLVQVLEPAGTLPLWMLRATSYSQSGRYRALPSSPVLQVTVK